MEEIVTEAFVVDREPVGEYDTIVWLYTRLFGGVRARATSLRKPTAKLAAHCDVLNSVTARLIARERGGLNYQMGDAITNDRHALWRVNAPSLQKGIKILSMVRDIAWTGGEDVELWNLLQDIFGQPFKQQERYEERLLGLLGLDPVCAACSNCGKDQPGYITKEGMDFYCENCKIRLSPREVVYSIYG